MPTLARPRIPAANSNIEPAFKAHPMMEISTVRLDRLRHFAHRFRVSSQQAARSGRLTHNRPALRLSGLPGLYSPRPEPAPAAFLESGRGTSRASFLWTQVWTQQLKRNGQAGRHWAGQGYKRPEKPTVSDQMKRGLTAPFVFQDRCLNHSATLPSAEIFRLFGLSRRAWRDEAAKSRPNAIRNPVYGEVARAVNRGTRFAARRRSERGAIWPRRLDSALANWGRQISGNKAAPPS
jgi:hypothetical protein